MSVLDALKGVLKLALMHDGLARGLREASKALDRRQAHVCILNESCEGASHSLSDGGVDRWKGLLQNCLCRKLC